MNDSIYIFGGYNFSTQVYSNIFINFLISSTGEIEENFLSPSYDYPSPRLGSSLQVIKGLFYVFGGNNGDYLNDLWSYNPSTEKWCDLESTGDQPSGRSYFSSSTSGDILMVWGGKDSLGLTNDMYILNTISSEWSLVQPSSNTVPDGRMGACLVYEMPVAYLFGGETSTTYSSELWKFDFALNTYALVSNFQFGVAYANCQIISNIFLIYGGVTDTFEIISGIIGYDLNENTWDLYNKSVMITPKSNGMLINNYLITFGGKNINYQAKNVFQIIQNDSIIFEEDTNFSPYEANRVYFGSKIYYIGGGYSLKNPDESVIYALESKPSSLFAFIDLAEIGDFFETGLVCSPGTYLTELNKCETCPPGTYSEGFGSTFCEPCGLGKYNSAYGASSILQCYPCPRGSFTNSRGTAICLQCLSSEYCPIGSIFPLSRTLSLNYESIQPYQYDSNIYDYDLSMFQLITFVVGVFLMLFIPIREKPRQFLLKIDIYQSSHNYKIGAKLKNKSTEIGGCFTLIFFLIILIYIVTVLAMFILENVSETKVQQPLPVIENFVSVFTADMEIEVTFFSYGDICGNENGVCAPNIEVLMTDFASGTSSIKCQVIAGSCIITLACKACSIESTSYINFYLHQKFSFASGIFLNFTSSSSIPESVSSIFTPIYAESNQVFIGSVASTFSINLAPSLFISSIPQYPNKQTGYHVILASAPVYGSQNTIENFGQNSELLLNIIITQSLEGVFTNRSQNLSFYMMITSLFGSIAGIMQSIGFIMRIFEKFYFRRKVLKKKKEKYVRTEENRQKLDYIFEAKNETLDGKLHNSTEGTDPKKIENPENTLLIIELL